MIKINRVSQVHLPQIMTHFTFRRQRVFSNNRMNWILERMFLKRKIFKIILVFNGKVYLESLSQNIDNRLIE